MLWLCRWDGYAELYSVALQPPAPCIRAYPNRGPGTAMTEPRLMTKGERVRRRRGCENVTELVLVALRDGVEEGSRLSNEEKDPMTSRLRRLRTKAPRRLRGQATKPQSQAKQDQLSSTEHLREWPNDTNLHNYR
ncbi:hypothetical protein LWI28_024508 [Acer negundo]|uniref:Uncharacterized protein n=1 Tax=Acer negundo TaxID=4023 RepID=A0AAD5IH05_ACENE|nr:hypothetical protein LWI28_024508 [Acer negundo]